MHNILLFSFCFYLSCISNKFTTLMIKNSITVIFHLSFCSGLMKIYVGCWSMLILCRTILWGRRQYCEQIFKWLLRCCYNSDKDFAMLVLVQSRRWDVGGFVIFVASDIISDGDCGSPIYCLITCWLYIFYSKFSFNFLIF